jgi:hypothetical protein
MPRLQPIGWRRPWWSWAPVVLWMRYGRNISCSALSTAPTLSVWTVSQLPVSCRRSIVASMNSSNRWWNPHQFDDQIHYVKFPEMQIHSWTTADVSHLWRCRETEFRILFLLLACSSPDWTRKLREVACCYDRIFLPKAARGLLSYHISHLWRLRKTDFLILNTVSVAAMIQSRLETHKQGEVAGCYARNFYERWQEVCFHIILFRKK